MKNNKEKTNHRNLVTIGGLSALCVAVLAGTFFLTREPEETFVIVPTEQGNITDTWNENSTPDTFVPSITSAETNQETGTVQDQTQVLVSKDENGTTVNLSGSTRRPDTPAETPPDNPVPTDDTTDPNHKPEYDPSVPEKQPDNPPADPSAPSNPDDGHPGQVYDPVFGWIDGGRTSQDTVDNGGDINTQIGTMGGK